MRKIALFVLCGLFIGLQSWAQVKTLKGKVADDNGNPLSGVTVSVKNDTKTRTVTGADGVFKLTVPANAKSLVFSYVGFQSETVAIGAETNLNLVMKPSVQDLDNVVVTGYTREKKSTFAGSAAILSGKIVENVPVGSFDQALQGRAAGVQVQSASGQPGASANITIRGISSVQASGAQPLYVIDGIPMPSFDMAAINPNDFESITVLKDANASALYGSRGGLGVIVITTKKGRSGQSNFSFRSSIGFTQRANTTNFELMNTQEMFSYEERLGLAGYAMTGPGWVYSKRKGDYATQTPATQARYDFLRDSIGAINTNHADLLFRQGFSQNYEMNLSGGGDKTKFFLSMAYFDQQGTDLRSRLRRYTTRFNIDHTIGKLNVSYNTLIGFALTDATEGEWRGNSALNPFQMSWRGKTYENPYRPDGSIIFGANTATNLRQIGNVLESIQNSNWTNKQLKVNSGLTLSYKILPTLTAKNVTGIDASFERGMRGIKANSYIGSLQTLNSGYQAEAYLNRAQVVNTSSLVYGRKFKDVHDVEVGGYFEVVRGFNDGFGMALLNLDPRLQFTGQGAGSLPTGGPQNAASATSGFGIRSYFATGKYSYNEKYSLNMNVRRDGTSRILNPANREITTWSAGVIWNAIRENFMMNQKIVSDLRFRASYGSVPNIGSITSNSYGISGGALYGVTNYLGPQMASFATTTAFGGSVLTGLVPSTPGNNDYKIEYIEKSNIGTDFAIWKNRARFTVDAYRNVTKDLFVSQPTPFEAGFLNASQPINAGSMENKGLEFSATVDIIKNRTHQLTFSWNHAINKNEITDLGVVSEYVVGTYIIRKGLPFGSHYAYDYVGADPTNGKPQYKTIDGKITNDINAAGRFATFGTYLPRHVGGFNLDYSFKGFTFGASFSYQAKVSRYNNIWNWITRGTPGYQNIVNASKVLLTQQWEKPGDVKFYQSPLYDRDFTAADIQDAKFLRFRGINMSYTIPNLNVNGKKAFKSIRLYAQVYNVWVWSPWKGPDPEDNNNISLNEFPNPRNTTMGLEVNF